MASQLPESQQRGIVGAGPHDVKNNNADFYKVAVPILTYIISNGNKIMNPPRDLHIRTVYRETLERMTTMSLVDLLTDRMEGPARTYLTALCLGRQTYETVGRLHTVWPEIVVKALRRDKRWYVTAGSAGQDVGKPAPPGLGKSAPIGTVGKPLPPNNLDILGKDDTVMGGTERFPGMFRSASRSPPHNLPPVPEDVPMEDVPMEDCPTERFPGMGRLSPKPRPQTPQPVVKDSPTERFPGMGRQSPKAKPKPLPRGVTPRSSRSSLTDTPMPVTAENLNLLGKDDTVMGVRVSDIQRFPGVYRPAGSPSVVTLPSLMEIDDDDKSTIIAPPRLDDDDTSTSIAPPRFDPPRPSHRLTPNPSVPGTALTKANLNLLGQNDTVMGVRVGDIERFPGMYRPAGSPSLLDLPSIVEIDEDDDTQVWNERFAEEDRNLPSPPRSKVSVYHSSPPRPAPRTPGSSSPAHGSSSIHTGSRGSSSFISSPLSSSSRVPESKLSEALFHLQHNPLPFPPPDSAVDDLLSNFRAMTLDELHATIPVSVKDTIDGLDELSAEEMDLVLPDLAQLTLMEWHKPE
jgi:hypothetical protein